MEYKVGEYVYLKVTPFKGTQRFQEKGKLAPRYIGPFWIYDRSGKVAYALALPDSLLGVYNAFHVSQLKRCLKAPEEEVSLQDIDINKDLSYKEYLIVSLTFRKGRLEQNYQDGESAMESPFNQRNQLGGRGQDEEGVSSPI